MRLEDLLVGGGQGGVFGGAGHEDSDVGGFVEGECWDGGGGGDGVEVGAVDVVEEDGWAGVGGFGLDFDVAHLYAVYVAEVEAVGGQGAEHGGLGVGVFFFGDFDFGLVGGASAGGFDVDVGELDVFYGGSRGCR